MSGRGRTPPGDVAIRHAALHDLDALNRLSSHYIETSHVTFDLEPYSDEKRLRWFEQFWDAGRHQLFVATRGEEFLGYAHTGAFRAKAAYETSVETTVYLDPAASGLGIGTGLYRALFDSLKNEDVHRVYAGIALPNPQSIALHERFGFRDIGTYHEVGRKFGRYWSVRWYELALLSARLD